MLKELSLGYPCHLVRLTIPSSFFFPGTRFPNEAFDILHTLLYMSLIYHAMTHGRLSQYQNFDPALLPPSNDRSMIKDDRMPPRM